ncbi:putative riboflavin kinase [Tetranychus urticae]|uniref:riboflavin kinase n=1 Tax=Tetranychus urticae TaxID=32264 RepID=T1KBG1_TETUR|nr:putative riboflavin kinase [Tetranychus urticae]
MSGQTQTQTETVRFPIYVSGKVVKGFGRGSSELGIPTANIEAEVIKSIPLSTGIYFGWSQLSTTEDDFKQLSKDQQDYLKSILVKHDSKMFSPVYMMSASLGYNPFYENEEKALEIHLLNKFNCDFYGLTINSLICGKIREEANFISLEALIKAIHNDIEETRRQLEIDTWHSFKKDDRYFVNL